MKTKDYIEEYVSINGIEQYFLHYPCESDLVVLYLHGGPGQSEAQFAYNAKDERLKCSIVYYDQRGTGKTQLKNRTKPGEITLEKLLEDLKETILYLKGKYHSEKIILVGHSWGSVLGTRYIRKNPQDIMCYVGTGQVIDMMKNEEIACGKLGQMIQEKGNQKDIREYSKYKGYPYSIPEESLLKTILSFRKLQGKYGITGDAKKTVKVFRKSPIFRLSDLYPMFTALKTNKNLFDTTFSYCINDDLDYKLPVFYICGRNDWQTPSIAVEEYFEKIRAPKKGLYWVEDAGHLAILDNPNGYNGALLKIIEEFQV